MTGQLLIEYLDRRRADYLLQPHHVAYTAPEIAQHSHVAGNTFAKVVMVKVDGELAMVVLPAHYRVDLDALTCTLGVNHITLATEQEFGYRFPRCEIGAMPPFGHLYGLDAFMISVFGCSTTIAFNAGTHSEIIRMPMAEFLRLACPTEVGAGALSPAARREKAVVYGHL